MDIFKLDIKETHKGLKEKQFSAVEVAKSYLERIKKENKNISAYFSVSEKLALSQAEHTDERIKNKEEISVLDGVPVAIKDNILVEGERNTCSSKILEEYVAPYDATVINKLKAEGAVILGKTNLDEFAMGASTENSAFFPTKNPNDLKRVPGGSSGGSAAAVADDMCCYALGSDTGGSIRQPASFCGVVGLKPTYGAVSRYGLVAFASSLDQIGPLAKTVGDAEAVFNIISGKDEKDLTSVGRRDLDSKVDISELTIGVRKEYFVKGIDKDVEKIVKEAIKKYEDMGAKIVEISLPNTKYAIPVYYLICTSEASSNLARYDGVKYGLHENKAKDLMDVYLKTREKGFGNEVKRRIMLGTYALSAGYYDAFYLKASKIRTLIKNDFKKAFETVDVIFSPVAPTPAFKLGEKKDDPLSMYLEDIYTAPVNLAGLPGLSVSAGKIGDLPVGLQIIGNYFEESKMFDVAKYLSGK